MKNGFKVIDCDRHVVQPDDLYERYLDPRYQHYKQVQRPRDPLSTPGGGGSRSPIWRGKFKGAYVRGFNTESYLFDMDKDGTDVAVCFPDLKGLYATWGDDLDPGLSNAMCRAYNNWLHDYMSPDPQRLKGVCIIPFQDLDLAEKELTRAANELGMVGLFWRPNPHMGRLLSDPALDRIYSLCEELDVTVCVHEGITNAFPWFAKGRVETRFAHHITCHAYEQMGAFLTMAAAGVFDRHPRLRAAYLESGAGWLPYWAERLDALHANPIFNDGYEGKLRPSEYFRNGQAYLSCEADEKTNAILGRVVGEDCLMWASDYPHADAMLSFPDGLDGLTSPEEAGISAGFIRKILWDNPARFFRLAEAQPVTAALGL